MCHEVTSHAHTGSITILRESTINTHFRTHITAHLYNTADIIQMGSLMTVAAGLVELLSLLSLDIKTIFY